MGRAIALLFLLWFVALVLGALGVAPNEGSHVSRAVGPQSTATPGKAHAYGHAPTKTH